MKIRTLAFGVLLIFLFVGYASAKSVETELHEEVHEEHGAGVEPELHGGAHEGAHETHEEHGVGFPGYELVFAILGCLYFILMLRILPRFLQKTGSE